MAFAFCSAEIFAQENDKSEVVVLLHGLARSYKSMKKMEKSLITEGFKTCNISYPSTKYSIDKLVTDFVLPKIQQCVKNSNLPVNFVTHSLGGIIVRYLAIQEKDFEIGRVVMLSPPNKGSEVVDKLGDLWLFGAINGPAGRELGTGKESIPNTLGPAIFDVGIITGNKSINWILSAIIEGKDDGKVSVENAKLEGMKDFLVIPATHPFIMKNKVAIEQTIYFLKNGNFKKRTNRGLNS